LQPSTLAKRGWLILVLIIVAFYLYGLGRLPLVGPDEPRYAQVAREMFLRRDFITPTLGGHTWFEKPVLLYWMMMAGYKLFGVSEWSARIGPAIAGLLTIVAIWWISRQIESISERQGFVFLATAVVASMAGLIVFARAASFDIVITLTLTWTCSFFLASEIETSKRKWRLAGFYAFMGLSLLAKGLIGVVLPAGIIGLFYLLRRRLPDRTFMVSTLWGLPLTLLVAAVWYGPVIARHGWPFINDFFIQHHFARYLSNKYQHPQPVYFYLPVTLLLALPWSVFLIEALFKRETWRQQDRNPASNWRLFVLAWLIVPIAFFSFSGSKLPGYVLPSLPAGALLIADRLSLLTANKEAGALSMRLTAGLCLVMAIAGIVYARQTGSISLRCAALVTAPAVLAAAFIFLLSRERLLSMLVVTLVPFVVVAFALHCVVDRFAPRESVHDLISQVEVAGYGDAAMVMFGRIERTAEFYGAGRVIYDSNGTPLKVEQPSEVIDLVKKMKQRLLFITPHDSIAELQKIQGLQARLIADNGHNAIVAVEPR